MFLPAQLLQTWKFLTQIFGAVPLEEAGNSCGTEPRRSGYEHMHMVFVGLNGKQRESLLFAAFGDQSFGFHLDITSQNFSSIFGDPFMYARKAT